MDEEKTKNKNNNEKEVATNKSATSFDSPKSSNKTNNRLVSLDNRPRNTYIPLASDDEDEEENSDDLENEDLEKEEKEETQENPENKENNNVVEEPPVSNAGPNLVQGLATIVGLKEKIVIIGIIVFLLFFLFFIHVTMSGYIGDELKDLLNSCTGSNGNLMTFLEGWEGNEGYCTVNGEQGYQSANLGDGAITLGTGFTNLAMSADVVNYVYKNGWQNYFPGNTVTVGMCVPIPIFERVQLYAIDITYAKAVDDAAEKYGVEFTQFQRDALTDFNYNQGPAYIDELVSSFSRGGYAALWNAMSHHTKGGMPGIMKRLKGEFALFVTGDYSDQGLFYERSLNNYDDYNSENVMSRRLICGSSSKDMIVPLDAGTYRCSSAFGARISPTAGASTNHGGVDLAANYGVPVHAALSGTISDRFYGVGGNTLYIDHGDGLQTSYMHMSGYNESIAKVGNKVQQGEVIGYVGSTGISTGNHLDFRVYENGQNVNPYDYLKDVISPYDGKIEKCKHN